MRPVFSRLLVSALLVAVTATPAFAVTYIVPSDREMIQRADDIVVATSVTSTVERTPRGGIVTRYILRIEEVLKGKRSAGSYVTLTELGGQLAGFGLYVSGMPVYEPGNRYLVFTDANADGQPRTWGLELGQFRLLRDDARMLALRSVSGLDQNLEVFRGEQERDADRFANYIRAIVAQRIAPTPSYFVSRQRGRATTNATFRPLSFTRASYLVTGALRWQGTPDAVIVTSGTASGADGPTSVGIAVSEWNSTSSNIAYVYNGTQDNTATGGFLTYDGKNAVLFNDPNGEVCGTCNPQVLAQGGYWTSGTPYSLGGEQFKDIDGGIDIVVDNFTFNQGCLNWVLVHEMGHTLGFRHSNQNDDNSQPCNTAVRECTTDAVMNSSVNCGSPPSPNLRAYDQTAAAVVYGDGPQCTPPTIQTQPQSQTITQGNQANLSVAMTAGSTGPFTYQWYVGTSGNTSSPVPGGTTSTINPSPTTTTMYWVRVTGQCAPAADSSTATVTVDTATCTPPSINAQPQDKIITAGQQANLFVGASGTQQLTFQWYFGATGDTSQPVFGQTNATLTHAPTQTTSYWVRVTGQCAPVADSRSATVTVNQGECTAPVINQQPLSQTITQGTTATLSVGAAGTGPLVYQWFIGTPPTGTQTGSNLPSLQVSPTVTTSYWVRVIGQCEPSAVSNAATVTVTSCQLPVITTEPGNQSIASGASATLSIASTGATTITWYRGPAGNKSIPIGTGNSVNTGALTQSTQFWANLTNSCGEKASRTVTVNVGSACTAPSITSTTPSMTIYKGSLITLNVLATGTAALHYQWYEGPAGNTTKPVGIDLSTFVTGPVNSETRFWVKVTNSCGNASSNTIDVNLHSSRRRSSRH